VARADPIRSSPNTRPFGLERTIDGKRSFLFFHGIEADCGTEPVDAADPERSSLAKKFAGYNAIAEQGVHRSYLGFPNFLWLNSMMTLVERLTGKQGSKIPPFKTFPSLISAERPSSAGGDILMEPWQRVGFPPLYLGNDHAEPPLGNYGSTFALSLSGSSFQSGTTGCSIETGSDAGKVFLRASSSASSWCPRASFSRLCL
jgi:hypothetical protein